MTFAATVKHNWLFICIKRLKWFLGLSRLYFILFSPFARKIITLPELTHSLDFTMTWSSQPDSPDCVFYLLDTLNIDEIALFTYRNGDKKWSAELVYKVDTSFLPFLCRLVYLHGMLYIVSPNGNLASYDIVGRKFKDECLLRDKLLALSFRSKPPRLLELDGELMIVSLGSNVYEHVTSTRKQCIKRYDCSTKAWIPVSTLSNRALFISDKNNEVAKIDTIDVRNSGVLSNKIYHFFDRRCLVYSIEDGELVEFKPADSNLLDYKNRYFGTFSDATKSVFWLEPPCVHVCSS